MSYRPIQPEAQKPDIPFRIQRKIDIYKAKGLEYLWQRDTKDKQELAFYQVEKFDQQKEKPTLIRQIHAIYRVRDDQGKEWIVWDEYRIVQDRTSQDVVFDDRYGVYPEPITRTEFDAGGKVTNIYVTRTLPKFDTPWNEENLQELLDIATAQPDPHFYVVPAGADYRQPMLQDRRCQHIGNIEDFKNGTFDELSDMGFKGFTYSKSPQLADYRAVKTYHKQQMQQSQQQQQQQQPKEKSKESKQTT